MNTRFIKQILALLLMLALVVPAVAFAEPATVELKLGVKEQYQIVGSTIPGAEGKTLVLLDSNEQKTVKSFANIPGVKTTLVGTLNPYEILKYKNLVLTSDAVKKIEEVYA